MSDNASLPEPTAQVADNFSEAFDQYELYESNISDTL